MGEVTLRAAGPAPVEQTWSRYVDLDRWSQWAPQIRRVQATGRQLRPGLHGRVVGPAGLAVRFRVDTVDDAARTWTWTVTLGVLELHLRHWVTGGSGPGEGSGSATGLTMHGPLPVLVAYAPFARWALHRLVHD